MEVNRCPRAYDDLLIEVGKETGNSSIINMKLAGMSQVDIAEKLGVHPSTVSERMRCCYNLVRQKAWNTERNNYKKDFIETLYKDMLFLYNYIVP